MIQKKNSNLILIIVAIVIVATITIIILLSQRSKQSDSDTQETTTSTPQTSEQIKESEMKNKLTIDEIVMDYVVDTYPTANNIQNTVEYAGLGYAIVNTTFSMDEENTTKKIYLKQANDTWEFLHESDENISCTTAREISASDSVLMLNCKE